MKSIIDVIINIIVAPFTLIYSIVTFSSYQKGARKNCYLLGIDEATYSKLLDMCQEGGIRPSVVKNIVETEYTSINFSVQKAPEYEKNLQRYLKILEIHIQQMLRIKPN